MKRDSDTEKESQQDQKDRSSKVQTWSLFSAFGFAPARETRKRSMKNLSILKAGAPPIIVRLPHQLGPMATN